MTESIERGFHTVTGALQPTFKLQKISEKMIPFQNHIPYPSFDPQERLVQSLEGKWKKQRFDADHDWTMEKRDAKWIKMTETLAEGITSNSFNDEAWEEHPVPLPENKMTGKAEVNGAETYENGVWYRRSFNLDDNWDGKTITLKCLGLSYVGDFWINGIYVGYHEGGFTPFAFDVTPFVISGKNTITVRVDNPPWTTRIDTIPAVDNDFFNYTGIIQDLYLEATTGVHVSRADIVSKGTDGTFAITVIVENRTDRKRQAAINCEVFGTDFSAENWLASPDAKSLCKEKVETSGLETIIVTLDANETKAIEFRAKIDNPNLWSINEPNLYVLKAELTEEEKQIDDFYTQFGIRSLKTSNAKILLNDEPVFLAGVARHEEWPSYGRTASWERIKSDFLKITELFVNMVRTAHYPNHIYTFIMLDRLGLTAMSEIPLWQFETHHYEAQEQRGISYQMWREMVFSHYNRPSIIMWSTQNESKDVKLRKQYNQNLVNEVRSSYHDGRLITQSAAADQPGHDDESMEPLDVAGWTMYFGIFHGSTPYEGTRDFIEKAHKKWPDKPIINTEYGIWSNADDSFLLKQVEIYRDVQLALLEKATVTPQGQINEDGYVAAIDYWTAFDWYVNHNNFYQTMGMYHMDRKTKKPLFYEFIKDHNRLMGETFGIGKSAIVKSAVSLAYDATSIPGSYHAVLKEVVDMTRFNYLTITVLEQKSTEGFIVEIYDGQGNSTSFNTYAIKANEDFEVYVPLWQLNQEVLSGAASIQIHYKNSRMVDIKEILCKMAGK